jgi:hypothetical protein
MLDHQSNPNKLQITEIIQGIFCPYSGRKLEISNRDKLFLSYLELEQYTFK